MTAAAWFDLLLAIVGGAVRVGTPFLFVSLGECLTEKSGRINLGLEGVLVFSAMAGFAGSYLSGSVWLGVLLAGASGALLASLHGLLCSLKGVSDIATGIALMLLGTGLAFYLGKPLIQPQAPQIPSIMLGAWSTSPQVQQALSINALFPLGVVLAGLMAWGFRNTRYGLIVRMAGDSSDASRALGYSVNGVRIAATTVGGFIAGLGARRSRSTTRKLERRPVERPGPDRRGARDLRALEPVPLPRRGAAVRRRRRDRAGPAVGRHQQRLLPLQRDSVRADAGDPRRHLFAQALAEGRADELGVSR